MNPVVGVVGASARAAVHSLARAGFAAWAVDLFADRDLARLARCEACSFKDYPATLPALAARFPPGPFLYTGGLENHPDVVAELAAARELWGNAPDVLRCVRDPWQLFPALAKARFAVPQIVLAGEPCPPAGRWLRKPLRSSAGLGIRFAIPNEAPSESHYFQEFIDGVPMSAVYCGTTLLGVTEQLIGVPWLNAKPFSYCGSIGPLDVTGEPGDTLSRLGSVLTMVFALRGVWNVDFILKDGHQFPVEVNPRYSASVEVLEHATGKAVFGNSIDAERSGARPAVGKAVYYAPHTITFPQSGPWDADLAGIFNPHRMPSFADIPAPGTVIPAGYPVLTMFASGSSPAECRERLQSRAAELDQLLAEATS